MEIEHENIFEKQIEELLRKEKKARQNSDHITSSDILQQIVRKFLLWWLIIFKIKLSLDLKEYKRHNELITYLSKRRG